MQSLAGHPTSLRQRDREAVRPPRSAAPRQQDALSTALAIDEVAPRSRAAAEEVAASCLTLFLCATLGQRSGATQPLGSVLFALGALDATAERCALDSSSRGRLEAELARTFFGGGRRRARAWRRALRRFEHTREGDVIRHQGELALRAWLRGESPAPYQRKALSSS